MKKSKGLGQGLDVLFQNQEHTELIENEKKDTTKGGGISTISISEIEPNKNQPRKLFDKENLEELTASIMEHGIITPLIVRPIEHNMYQIVAGERRWRAARMAGLREVPVIIKTLDDSTAAQFALIENLQRQDLNPVEEAMGYKTLMEDYQFTQEQVSKSVGKSRPVVANALRLLSLPKDVLNLLENGKLTPGHAKVMVALGDKASKVAQEVIKKELTVRQTEKLVKAFSEGIKTSKTKPSNIYLDELAQELSESLQRKVKVLGGGKKGKIEIEYYGNDDLENLITNLRKI